MPRRLRGCATSTQGVCHAKLRVSDEYGYVRCAKGMCTAKSLVPAGCVYALCKWGMWCAEEPCVCVTPGRLEARDTHKRACPSSSPVKK